MVMAGAAVSRRALLGGLGVGGVGAAVGAVGAHTWQDRSPAPDVRAGTVAFHGEHQGGIATEAQDRLAFASFDVVTTDRGELRDLLREWTAAAAAMTRGLPVPGDSSRPDAPPADTGETEGMAPGLLTVTAGFGPSLFDDRFGLAPRPARPAAGTCRPCPATASTPAAPAATSRSRPAPRTPRSPSTSSATWPASAGASCRCAGPSSASAARPPRPAPSRRRAT